MKTFFIIGKSSGFRHLFFALVGVWCLSMAILAQDLPKEIRGYKLYRAKISVKNQIDKEDNFKSSKSRESEAFIEVGDPRLTEISLTGISFELAAEINSPAQSGKIDFLSFRDFRVNGLKVEVEEYQHAFEFEKKQQIVLPQPFRIFVGTKQTLRGALSEWTNSKPKWMVTGSVFVFGRFRKAGFKFKRVVPIEINLEIENPLLKSSKNSKQANDQ